MIDIHNHILNDLDDGPSTLEESLAMAYIAFNDGIEAIVTTPHDRDVLDRHSIEKLVDRKRSLDSLLKQNEIPLNLFIGMENHMELDLIKRVKTGRSIPIEGTRYILIELPFGFYPYYTKDVLHEIQSIGLIPIIVHPERNVAIQKDISLAVSLNDMGVFLQIDSGSIEGIFGYESELTSNIILQQGLASFIATDAHSNIGSRMPIISRSVAIASQMIGDNEAENLVIRNPRILLSNNCIPN